MSLRVQKNISTRAIYLLFAVLSALILLSFQYKIYNFFIVTKIDDPNSRRDIVQDIKVEKHEKEEKLDVQKSL